MVRRSLQSLAIGFITFVVIRYVVQNFDQTVLDTYRREISFGIVSVVTAYLFAIARTLRPVVALFAAIAFFGIAKLDTLSAANFFAALDEMTDRVLSGITVIR